MFSFYVETNLTVTGWRKDYNPVAIGFEIETGGHFFRVEGLATFNGCSDILGWNSEGIFSAIEVKIGNRPLKKLQKIFLEKVPRAMIARVFEKEKNKPEVHLFSATGNDFLGILHF